ncbi:MAG: hypothetical protein Q7R86_01845 [bacterium]|nr:hypothetical protein [bacterium]
MAGTQNQKSLTVVNSFEDINTPGAWLAVDSGQLLQLTPESIKPGHSPVFGMPGVSRCVLLSGRFDTPMTKLRLIASQNGYQVNPASYANSPASSSANQS